MATESDKKVVRKSFTIIKNLYISINIYPSFVRNRRTLALERELYFFYICTQQYIRYWLRLINKMKSMQTVVLHGKSKADMKLLADLAKKIGVKVKYLTEADKEDIGMLNAINTGRTGEHVSTDNFLKNLKKWRF